MTTSKTLPNLSPEQQLELQNNCRELREREKITQNTIEQLMESNQMTTVNYNVINTLHYLSIPQIGYFNSHLPYFFCQR